MSGKPAKASKKVKKGIQRDSEEEAKEPVESKPEQISQGVYGNFVSEQHFQHTVYRYLTGIQEQTSTIADILGGILQKMSDVQSQIDSITQELTTIETDFKSEWAAVEAQVNSGQVPDLTGLKAVVDKFTADDAAWKQTPSAAPSSGTTGGGTTPPTS